MELADLKGVFTGNWLVFGSMIVQKNPGTGLTQVQCFLNVAVPECLFKGDYPSSAKPAVKPPSAINSEPVEYELSSEAR